MKQTLSFALSLLVMLATPFAFGRWHRQRDARLVALGERFPVHLAARETGSMKRFLQGARGLSSYLLIALLVPGGSAIALLAWLFRQRSRERNAPGH